MLVRLIFRSLYWLTALLAVGVLVFAVLVLGGLVPVASETVRPREAVPAAPAATTTSPATTTATATATERAEQRRPVARKAPALATVVVTASRGDCWLQARSGSESGRVLEERILARESRLASEAARSGSPWARPATWMSR